MLFTQGQINRLLVLGMGTKHAHKQKKNRKLDFPFSFSLFYSPFSGRLVQKGGGSRNELEHGMPCFALISIPSPPPQSLPHAFHSGSDKSTFGFGYRHKACTRTKKNRKLDFPFSFSLFYSPFSGRLVQKGGGSRNELEHGMPCFALISIPSPPPPPIPPTPPS